MDMLSKNDKGKSWAPVTADDLSKTLGFTKQHRNPVVVNLRKHGCPMPDGADEQAFYERFIEIVNHPEPRAALKTVLDVLHKKKPTKPVYRLHLRLWRKAFECLRMLNQTENRSEFDDLDPDNIFETLDTRGQPSFLRVYRWLVAADMVPSLFSQDKASDEATEESYPEDALDSPDEPESHRDPIADWNAALAMLQALLTDAAEPDLALARQLVQLATKARESAESYADTSRIEDARAVLLDALAEAGGLGLAAAAAVHAALGSAVFGPADLHRLEDWRSRGQPLIETAQTAKSRLEDAERELAAAYAEKRYGDLGTLGPEAEVSRKEWDSCAGELHHWLEALLQELTGSLPPPDSPGPEPDSTDRSAEALADTSPGPEPDDLVDATAPEEPPSEPEPEPEPESPTSEEPPPEPEPQPIPPEWDSQTETATAESVAAPEDLLEAAKGEQSEAPPPAMKTVDLAQATAALWQAVGDGRYGLAWHLARNLPRAFAGPPGIFQALALNLCVVSDDDEASILLNGALKDVLPRLDDDWGLSSPARDLLLFAATPRGVLLAPYISQTRTLLEATPGLKERSGFSDLRQTLLDAVTLGERLTPTLLRGEFPQAEWEAQARELRQDVKTWFDEVPNYNASFHRATIVWRNWVSEQGVLGRILSRVLNEQSWNRGPLKDFLDEYRDNSEIDRLIAETETRQTHESIEGRARKQLFIWFDVARGLVRRCLDLLDARPSDQGRLREVFRVRERLLGQIAQAEASLDKFNDGTPPQSMGAIVNAARHALTDLKTLLEPEPDSRPWKVWNALYEDLLFDASIRLDEDWKPPGHLPGDRLISLALHPRNLDVAMEARCQSGDLRAAERLLDSAETGPGADKAEALRKRFQDLGDEQRRVARSELERLRTRLEMALLTGARDEDAYAQAALTLQGFDDGQASDLRYWRERFADIDQRITEGNSQLRHKLQERLAGVADKAVEARIRTCLDQNDLLTAAEYLTLYQTGEPLPEPEQEEDHFARFYPALVQPERRPVRKPLKQDVLERKPLGAVSLKTLPGERLNTAAELVDAWRGLETRLQTGDQDLKTMAPLVKQVFSALDFPVIDVKPLTPGAVRNTRAARPLLSFELVCQPLTERSRCPVPYFGSQAKGHYWVRCITEEPVDKLLSELRSIASPMPMITLLWGWLDEGQRRSLAHLSQQYHQNVLIVDEALIYALCGETGDRTRSLFGWTLPFTALNPFITTAGQVPPELFYGRLDALRQVHSPREGYLLYGGRQLGKTALLAMAEHRWHDKDKGVLAIRIDLKSEGIGYGRGAHELWEVIAQRVNEVVPRLIDSQLLRNLGRDSGEPFVSRLRNWLNANAQRRLLLMLDEADAFLHADAADAPPFAVVVRLKQLMEETGHRFKVVFAGLHDVQRTARLARVANSPIAHFGRGICIGPLLGGGESREARRLLVKPLEALGYRFQTPDLPCRILALANYYPSLIQVFGYHLLDRFPARGNVRSGPPYTITSQHIDDTFRKGALRDEFVNRFAMTIELDPRYHLIALIIAQQELEQRETRTEGQAGVTASWTRDSALSWWPQGFADQQGFEDFHALLQEMVGLGVLRILPGSPGTQPRYVLRSPGIVHMLGGKEHITHALGDIIDSQPPQLYEAEVFHRHMGIDNWARSPLTGRQEELLHTLLNDPLHHVMALISGPLGAAPGDIDKLIRQYDKQSISLKAQESLADLRNWLRRREDYKDGPRFCVIGPETPWTSEWLTAAAETLDKLGRRTIKLLFIGDAQTAWRWVAGGEGRRPDPLRVLPWQQRAVKQWLRDINCPASDEDCQSLLAASGGWGQLLNIVGKQVAPSRRQGTALKRETDNLARGTYDQPIAWPDPVLPAVFGEWLEMFDGDPVEHHEAQELLSESEALSDQARTSVAKVMNWGELLGWLEPVIEEGQRRLRINPVLGRLLGRA